MTGKQRAMLRGMANGLDAIFQIGKGGVNDQLIRQVDETLEKRELIKLSVLESSPQPARQAADIIAQAVSADVITVIGRKFVLYRESKENKKIVLPKKR